MKTTYDKIMKIKKDLEKISLHDETITQEDFLNLNNAVYQLSLFELRNEKGDDENER